MQKKKVDKKKLKIRLSIFFGICAVLLLTLFFSLPIERIINNTTFFNESDFVNSKVKFHFIDVGQGDCSVIQVEDKTIMIDCGSKDNVNKITRYLTNLGFKDNDKIDYLILTHTDSDHIGGACEILSKYKIENVYIPKVYSNYEVENDLDVYDYNVVDSNIWNNTVKAILNEVTTEHLFYSGVGKKIIGNNFIFNFYAPLFDSYDEDNDYSPIIMFNGFNCKAMFVGDADAGIENDFLNYYETDVNNNFFDCDILKVGHHGSKYSTSSNFLNAIKPEIAVISVGEDNSFGHPTEETLTRLTNIGCKVYRTDTMDNVVVYKTQENLSVKSNLQFVGNTYFYWWYFVLGGISLSIFIIFPFKTKDKSY